MRIAVLADIHGNIHALEAVLEHVQKQSVDQVIIAGDIVIGCPSSKACWETVKSLNCMVIRGNHERYLFDLESPHSPASWQTESYGPVHQAFRQFSQDTIDCLRALPAWCCIDDLLIVHASYRNDVDAVRETSTESELEEMFAGSSLPHIIRAHNHVWFNCSWASRTLSSVGSVGLPLNGDARAQYAITEKRDGAWKIERYAITYDIGTAIESFELTNHFDSAGPIGKLYRQELITAKHELSPFWVQFGEAYNKGKLSLEQAVNKYLNQ